MSNVTENVLEIIEVKLTAYSISKYHVWKQFCFLWFHPQKFIVLNFYFLYIYCLNAFNKRLKVLIEKHSFKFSFGKSCNHLLFMGTFSKKYRLRNFCTVRQRIHRFTKLQLCCEYTRNTRLMHCPGLAISHFCSRDLDLDLMIFI